MANNSPVSDFNFVLIELINKSPDPFTSILASFPGTVPLIKSKLSSMLEAPSAYIFNLKQ